MNKELQEKIKIAKDPNTDSKTLETLAQESALIPFVIQNENIDYQLKADLVYFLDDAINGDDGDVSTVNPDSAIEALNLMDNLIINDYWGYYTENDNGYADKDLQSQLRFIYDESVEYLVDNTEDLELLEKLFDKFENDKWGKYIADTILDKNNLDSDLINKLAKSENQEIRKIVALSEKVNLETLTELAKDKDKEVSTAARNTIEKIQKNLEGVGYLETAGVLHKIDNSEHRGLEHVGNDELSEI